MNVSTLTHIYVQILAKRGVWNVVVRLSVLLGLCVCICLPSYSHAQVTLSGTVYSDAGVTPQAVSKTISVAVGTSTVGRYSTTTTVTSGAWTVTIPLGHGIATGTRILVWVDNDATTRASVLTKANSSATAFSITGLDLYKNRVIARHEASTGTSTTNTDFSFYTSAQDTDLQHSTTSTGVTIAAGNELYVWAGKTLAPGGNLTVAGNASTSATDGSMYMAGTAVYTAGGTLTLAGSLTAVSTAAINSTSTIVFNATTTGKVINAPVSSIGNVTFNGLSGGWTFTSAATTSALTILQGTVVAPSTTLGVTGIFQNDATFTHNGGTLNIVGAVSSALGDIAAYVAGRDISGSATGTGNLNTNALAVSTNNQTMYMGKAGSATLCNPTNGNAIGCELMVFDVSSTTNPSFVTARDSSGDSASSSIIAINSMLVSGNYLYVTKNGSSAVCNNTVGSAAGCELMVFDISSTTNPIFVTGRDADGTAAGTTSVAVNRLAISGTILYMAKAAAGSVACTTQANCELMVFDIASSTNPIYVTGRDASGSAAGVQTLGINGLSVAGSRLYVGKAGSATACSQTAGSAVGCELMVFDISSTTNPIFVAGRDADGSAVGTSSVQSMFILASSTTVYVGKSGLANSTPCSQTAGLAEGCELMVFDAASSTNPLYRRGVDVSSDPAGSNGATISALALSGNNLYVGNSSFSSSVVPCLQFSPFSLGCEIHIYDVSSSSALRLIGGRDSAGDSASTSAIAINAVQVVGNNLFVAKSGSATGCSQTAGTAVGCELMVFDVSRQAKGLIMGTFVGTSALGNVVASGTVEFRDNASTSHLTIVSGTTTAPSLLTLGGSYLNSANFDSGEGKVVFSSSSAQTLSGNLNGDNAFYRLEFLGAGTKTMGNNASTTFLEISANASVVLPSQITVNDTLINDGTLTATNSTLTTNGVLNEFTAGLSGGLSSTDAVSSTFDELVSVGNIVYVAKSANTTNCSQTAGLATGCELVVVSISSTTNPIYVAGRDESGVDNGTGAVSPSDVAVSTNNQTLYLAKTGNSTTCTPTIGSATGCELVVFDISSTTNPIFVTGRDSAGSNASTSAVSFVEMLVSGNYLYVTKGGSSAVCNNTAGSAAGCELMVFDISSTTNPIYVAGRDADGTAAGITSVTVNSLAISGTTLYIAKAAAGSVACTTQANCELMVFDISSSTNPTYVTGRDASGSAAGVQTLAINSISISGTRLLVGKAGSATACSQTAGSAVGCELMVFDISSTTNPVFVAGRDVDGSAVGTGNVNITQVTATGTLVYVGKQGENTACSLVAGLAIGCELMVFDTASSTNPVYVHGRDSNSSVRGRSTISVSSIMVLDDTVVIGKGGDVIPCSQTATLRTGCELMIYKLPTTLSGTLTGSSGLATVTTNGFTKFITSASTTNLSISTSSILTAPSSTLSISGDFSIAGTFVHNNGLVSLNGTNQRVTASATTTFYDFSNVATVAATTTFSTSSPFIITRNLTLSGTTSAPLKLRSVSPGSQWKISPQSSTTIIAQYLDVQDSNNISTITSTLVCDTGCVNSGNNINWTFSSSIVGSTTLASHSNGQVANAITSRDKINESLFAFQLIPNSGTATVTNMIITVSGVTNIIPGDFSNLRLLRDQNNNGQYEATDGVVGGVGALVISGENGTLTFIDDFLSTTTQNYIVVGDWNAPANGALMTFALTASNITVIDGNPTHVVTGAVSSVQHRRNNKGGGGGSANIGEPTPAGAGVVSGGGNTGGEVIGSDPDFVVPTSNSGLWNNGANAYDGTDGTYATTSSATNQSYANHGFGIPSSNTISGIVVKLEISGTTAAGTVDVELSWNGGTNWTSVKTTPTLTTADSVRTLGSPSDLWGRIWTSTEFANGNFSVRLTGAPNTNTIQLDAIQVRVYHTTGGGGAGGGAGGGGI